MYLISSLFKILELSRTGKVFVFQGMDKVSLNRIVLRGTFTLCIINVRDERNSLVLIKRASQIQSSVIVM